MSLNFAVTTRPNTVRCTVREEVQQVVLGRAPHRGARDIACAGHTSVRVKRVVRTHNDNNNNMIGTPTRKLNNNNNNNDNTIRVTMSLSTMTVSLSIKASIILSWIMIEIIFQENLITNDTILLLLRG